MKKFFLRKPFFRLLTPLIVGSVAYMLILLFNNNVSQLQEAFLGGELYFSIGLALLIQEVILQCLRPLLKIRWQEGLAWTVVGYTTLAFFASILLVGLAVSFYYTKALGYQPAASELILFCSIFGVLAGLQISLYVSHQLLFINNEDQLKEEQQLRAGIIADFHQFKRGINPDLLLESLETLIVYLYDNKDLADDMLDHLAAVYRYVLTARRKELVPIYEELTVLQELIALLGHLPYRKIAWQQPTGLKGHVVPGTLLLIVEAIIRSSIVISDQELPIVLLQNENSYQVTYPCLERIRESLSLVQLTPVVESYAVYSQEAVCLIEEGGKKTVRLPIIELP